VQPQVNLRGTKKHHDTIRGMMATLSHVFSCISRRGTQWVYGGRSFIVSARTNKRHHQHGELGALGVSCVFAFINRKPHLESLSCY
jgi:hypothetical protein